MDDKQILDLYFRRSESAIVETSKKYENYCFTIANNILNNQEDAQECVNDTFLKAWEAIPPERPKQFRAYLGKITRNLSLNKQKENFAQKRGSGVIPFMLDELAEILPASTSVEQTFEGKVVTEALNDFLGRLDKENRILFVRRYWYADAISDISDQFGMSESKVKSRLFRIRKQLKRHLDKEDIRI